MTSNVYKFAGMSPRMHNPHIRRHQFRSIKDIKMKILPYIHIFHVLLGLNFQVDILILRRMVSKTVKILFFFTHPLIHIVNTYCNTCRTESSALVGSCREKIAGKEDDWWSVGFNFLNRIAKWCIFSSQKKPNSKIL